MPDLRLAVCLPEVARVRVAARLRNAVVGPADGCDAALLRWDGDRGNVERLLAAKAHVLLLAEPCPARADLDALIDTARAAGAQLAVVNPDRYLPSRQLIRQHLPARLGEPGLIRLHRWEPAAPATTPSPDGLLRDLDVALWLAGRRPDRVFALSPGGDGRCVQVHLGFPGGCMALLDFDGRLPPGDDYRSLTVIAFAGAAYADDHQNTQLLYRGGRPLAVRAEEHAGQLAAIAQEFVDALRDGHDPTAGTGAWRDVFTVAAAVNHSIATKQAVTPEEP